ncbi:MAG: acyl-CoA oxidase [Cognaticolwellia sp.]|jgi:acyl-CoA oxidase
MPQSALLLDPAYLPYLPLIHLAWADGQLSPQELQAARSLVSEQMAPGIDAMPVLSTWLDPDSPPTATQLVQLRARIRELARDMPLEERRGLAQLGFALSQQAGQQPLPKVVNAVQELERALQLSGDEPTRALLGELGLGWVQADQTSPPSGLDVGAITAMLDADYPESRQRIRQLLKEGALRQGDLEISKDDYRAWILEQLQVIAENGIGALAYPGIVGQNRDIGDFMACFEALADGDLSLLIKFGVQFGLFGGAIFFLGTERHHALLPKVASLELPGCFAMTETGHGSNVRSLGTTATFDLDRDGFVIHTPDRASWKDYIGNAACHGQQAVVFARMILQGEDYGVHPLLVPIRTPQGESIQSVHIQDNGLKLGLNGLDNGRIAFDQHFVPRSALLDRYAQVDAQGNYSSPINSAGRRFFTMIGTLVGGRVSVGSAAVGASRSALAIAVRYAEKRRQFGPADQEETRILDYHTHQRRLFVPLAEAYALSFANRDLIQRYVHKTEESAREVESLAAGLKSLSTWHATATIQTCREACGGQGYLAENRFARLKADTEVFTTFEGDNTVLLQLVAKAVLTEYAGSVGDQRVFGVLRLVWDRARTELGALDPVTPRLTSSDALRNIEFQVSALAYRQAKLTWSLAGRLRRRVQGGMDSSQAANECGDHMQALAISATEAHVLEVFDAALQKAEGQGVKEALTKLRDLYALSRIENDQAWFLRHGVIEANKARAIRNEIHVICLELRPMAVELVNGFGIPEVALGAPIALD